MGSQCDGLPELCALSAMEDPCTVWAMCRCAVVRRLHGIGHRWWCAWLRVGWAGRVLVRERERQRDTERQSRDARYMGQIPCVGREAPELHILSAVRYDFCVSRVPFSRVCLVLCTF